MHFRIPPHTYLSHIASWRFVLTLVLVLAADRWLEHTKVIERAVLGGYDTALERSDTVYHANGTVVVGITSEDVARYFGGQRPIPAAALDSVIRRLLSLDPGVLVVDIFTDDSSYKSAVLADSLLLTRQEQLVWAQFVDTTNDEVLPAVGGISAVPGRAGVALMTADQDRLVRRFRLRFVTRGSAAAGDTLQSLPYAATLAYTERGRKLGPRDDPHGGSVRLDGVPDDTGSIGLRPYLRDPPFYVLDDVLSADLKQVATSPKFAGKVVVLGFVDGSDQLLTPNGVRPGSEVVADAIETVLDKRKLIRPLPAWTDWLVKIALALLIAYIHYSLPPRYGAAVMIVLAILVVRASFSILAHSGIWTNYILVVMSIWIEQLYEDITHSPAHA